MTAQQHAVRDPHGLRTEEPQGVRGGRGQHPERDRYVGRGGRNDALRIGKRVQQQREDETMERRGLKHSANAAMNEAATGTRSDTEDRTSVTTAGVGALALIGLVVGSTAMGMEWTSQQGNSMFAVGGAMIVVTAIVLALLVIMGERQREAILRSQWWG